MFCDTCKVLLQEIGKEVMEEINILAREACYGCQFERPGQMDHDKCLMLSSFEKIEEFFEKAWINLDFQDCIKTTVLNFLKEHADK